MMFDLHHYHHLASPEHFKAAEEIEQEKSITEERSQIVIGLISKDLSKVRLPERAGAKSADPDDKFDYVFSPPIFNMMIILLLILFY